MTSLPSVSSLDEYEAIRHDNGLFRPGAISICSSLGLGSLPISRFPDGSLPVYAVGDALALKLYPPFEHRERDHEATALVAIERRLPIPTPGVRAIGEFDHWAYLLMDRLHGRGLAGAWPQISATDRLSLVTQLGEGMRALHAIRGPSLEPLRLDWPVFVAEQRRTAVERQRARGLDEHWCEQIPAFLDAASGLAAPAESLLHTEIMRDHLLVEPTARGWRLTGLFDFEPAMVGAIDYEFVAAGLFVTAGDPSLFRALLRSYGSAAFDGDAAGARRRMAWCLLHRYCNLPWFLKCVPPPAGARTLEELADRWFRSEQREVSR